MFWQGKICPVCKEEFSENEDIVFCPDCGTAHHRACWQQKNSCFYQEEHEKGNFDTSNETSGKTEGNSHREARIYSGAYPNDNNIQPRSVRPDLVICPVCGTYNKKEMRLCMNCGFEFSRPQTQYAQPDSTAAAGGVDFSTEAEEGVTYQELARFCGFMAEDYLRKFEKIKEGGISFSIPGFVLSFLWLIYRKMYSIGLIMLTVCSLPMLLYNVLIMGGTAESLAQIVKNGTDYTAMMAEYQVVLSDFLAQHAELRLLLPLTFLLIAIAMIFTGFMGNRLYYRKAVYEIRKIKAGTEDTERVQTLIMLKGGANMMMPFLVLALAYAANSFVSLIVYTMMAI